MEQIYCVKYWNDTMDEAKKSLAEHEPELQATLSAHPFFATCPKEACESFFLLASLCHQLAAHEDAEMEIRIDPDERIAEILLSAPCFLFQSRQFLLLQKISLRTNEIIFDVTEEMQSQMVVIFDFKKTNELLSYQYESALASLKN